MRWPDFMIIWTQICNVFCLPPLEGTQNFLSKLAPVLFRTSLVPKIPSFLKKVVQKLPWTRDILHPDCWISIDLRPWKFIFYSPKVGTKPDQQITYAQLNFTENIQGKWNMGAKTKHDNPTFWWKKQVPGSCESWLGLSWTPLTHGNHHLFG